MRLGNCSPMSLPEGMDSQLKLGAQPASRKAIADSRLTQHFKWLLILLLISSHRNVENRSDLWRKQPQRTSGVAHDRPDPRIRQRQSGCFGHGNLTGDGGGGVIP